MPSDRNAFSIDALYSNALAMPVEQREQYLAANCADEAALEELRRRFNTDLTLTIADGGSDAQQDGLAPALTVGSRLGHYRIQGSLGAGGMGYVYEALDEVLNRTVAVKVLPLGRYDEASRKRFRREAEAASALNHPNIVTVHEVGREGEIDYIAMERISGHTLRKVLDGRPMELRKALGIAAQIADALAAAHEAGIVHRDLKPANVMVNHRGIVKVLDFGLAKQLVLAGEAEVPGDGGAGGPGDGGADVTVLGAIVGTVAYMSPEQAEGRPVDARSDIFSFGSVLYEMLTGRRPFQGESDIQSLTAILASEPEPLRSLRPDAPKLLESVVQKCLRKQPYERWQSLADVKLMLEDLAVAPDAEAERAPAPGLQRGRDWFWYAAAALVAGVALTIGAQRLWQGAPNQLTQATLRLVTAEKGLSTAPALSRDGSLLAIASDRANEGNLDIWIQQVGGGEPMQLTSDVWDETEPAFSPDGARVAYRSEKDGGGIYIIPALGGDPVLVAPHGRNPRFSPDGKSMAYWAGRRGSYVPGSSRAFLIDFTGGAPRALETGLAWAQYPVWSPDGSSLLLYGMTGTVADRSAVDWWVVPAAGGLASRVGIRSRNVHLGGRAFPVVLDWYAGEDGPQVLYASDGGDHSNLWRLSLQADGKGTGAPVRVTIGPGRQVSASLTRSKEGAHQMTYADEAVNYDVWRLAVDQSTGLAAGRLEAVTNRLTPEMNPSISGDEKQVYFITTRMGTWSVVRKDLDTSRERVLFSSPGLLYNSRVAARGSKLFFSKLPSELLSIPSGGGVIEKLCAGCGSVTGVSPQGDRVLMEPEQDDHLMMFDVASRQMTKLADRSDSHLLLSGGQFSPDGKWVAFSATNNQTRASAVYLIPISGPVPVPRAQWIPIVGESDFGLDPTFAPVGPFLYFTSEKDGFRCLWARRLHPISRVPAGDAFPVQHFHTSRLALRTRASSGNIISLSAGGNSLVFALTETTGNVWLEETKFAQ